MTIRILFVALALPLVLSACLGRGAVDEPIVEEPIIVPPSTDF